MPMLGDMLAEARDSAGRFQTWLRASEPLLADRVAAAAADTELSPTAYVRAAVADFARFASEEDWATLTSSLRDGDDPGTTCLLAMVDWRLTANGCARHDHQDHRHQRLEGASS